MQMNCKNGYSECLHDDTITINLTVAYTFEKACSINFVDGYDFTELNDIDTNHTFFLQICLCHADAGACTASHGLTLCGNIKRERRAWLNDQSCMQLLFLKLSLWAIP